MACPELEDLERHLAGDLPEEQDGTVSGHVAGCPTCAEQLDEVSRNLRDLDSVQEALRSEEAAAELDVPERIGAFRIIREIARGGMGVVYLAAQDRPQRQVALKVLRPGTTSAEALRRFELEAHVLARLRHPGIATVYEAGVTTLETAAASDRVPYIAMEFVQGERLDRYAESHRLSQVQRLDLLARIADAVHHAHVKGLVHRDLKPGNILVEPSADRTGAGAPKVLDFGVARIADDEQAGTLRTSTGQILGTVPYMSPEQVAGDPSAVDVRSDVYALGVVAFELLTGELPHDVKRTTFLEAAAKIREEPPRAPSRFAPELRGDVETILLRALEKDPARRYPSAAELAADIRRFLRREPIQARPQSTWYQLRRFSQRNRALVISSAALALTLLLAAAVSTMLALRAARAEEEARQQLQEARRQAERFQAVNRFLEGMLAAASPEKNPGGRDLTVRDALASGIGELDAGSLADQQDIELGVRAVIGDTYRALGDYEGARVQLERAVQLGRGLYPDGHVDLADTLNKLARTVEEIGDLELAEALNRECLEMRRRLSGPRSVDTALSLNNLGYVLSRRGEREAALTLYEEALAIRRESLGPAHEDIANSLNNIAVLLYSMGKLEEAEPTLRESLEMDRQVRGDRHPNVAATMNNLAMLASDLGRLEEAESLHRQALDLEREIYGSDHPHLARSLMNLARLLVRIDELDEAEPMFEEALAIERTVRGPRHPVVANVLGNYAALFEARGDFQRAAELHREALSIRTETLGDDAVPTLGSRYNLARVALESDRPEEAARMFAPLAQDARRLLPADSRHLFTILSTYGFCLAELQRNDEAAAALREAHAAGTASLEKTDPRLEKVAEVLSSLESPG